MTKDELLNPFDDFKIASHKPLEGLKRSICPKCNSSRMYFCYTCFCYMKDVKQDLLPKIKLPLSVDIIKHPKELDGKSTAVHAAVLASEDVHVYTYPMFPNYAHENTNAILIFPGPDAMSMNELIKTDVQKTLMGDQSNDSPKLKRARIETNETKNVNITIPKRSDENSKPIPSFDKIVLIDSTWNQVHSISTDTRLKGLPRVELKERNTMYWRRQHHSPNTYLSTIEALYCFVKQYHELFIGEYNQEYDNLLYFFKFFYMMVHKKK